MMMSSFHPSHWNRAIVTISLSALLLLGVASPLVMAAETNAAPVQPSTPATDDQNFGQYLADHQDDLEPFFKEHGNDLLKEAVPLLIALLINIILVNVVIGWFFNVGISFGFSKLFAPAYARIKQAIFYATGHLVLGGLIGLLVGLVAMGVAASHSGVILVIGGIFVLIVDFAAQTAWVIAIYRTSITVSCLFYLSLIGIHLFVGTLLSGTMAESRVKGMVTQFLDQNVTNQMKLAMADTQHQLATLQAARDKVKDEVDDAQNRIDQAATEEQTLRDDIEAKKNSEIFVYGRIVRTHAQGDLTGARDQINAFLAKFPSGSLTDAAKAQLAMIESELASQEAQKKKAEDDAAAAVAQARADLLARAAKGELTLSEIRQALIGKTRPEVSDLFGMPSETASDRWGYGQKMVLNPLTTEKHGLTVYFLGGTVQSVDYYYGGAAQ